MQPINKTINALKAIAFELNEMDKMRVVAFVVAHNGYVLVKYESWYGEIEYWLNPDTHKYPELGGCMYIIRF